MAHVVLLRRKHWLLILRIFPYRYALLYRNTSFSFRIVFIEPHFLIHPDSACISVYFFCYMEIRLHCSESLCCSLCCFAVCPLLWIQTAPKPHPMKSLDRTAHDVRRPIRGLQRMTSNGTLGTTCLWLTTRLAPSTLQSLITQQIPTQLQAHRA